MPENLEGGTSLMDSEYYESLTEYAETLEALKDLWENKLQGQHVAQINYEEELSLVQQALAGVPKETLQEARQAGLEHALSHLDVEVRVDETNPDIATVRYKSLEETYHLPLLTNMFCNIEYSTHIFDAGKLAVTFDRKVLDNLFTKYTPVSVITFDEYKGEAKESFTLKYSSEKDDPVETPRSIAVLSVQELSGCFFLYSTTGRHLVGRFRMGYLDDLKSLKADFEAWAKAYCSSDNVYLLALPEEGGFEIC